MIHAMFDLAEVVQLKDGERVQTLVRRHVSRILPALFLSGALIVVPFFFLFTFVRFGSIGIGSFVLLIVCGFFYALKTFFIWDATVFIVTNQRLVQVDQRSLWNRIVSEIALMHVRDLQWERRGVQDTIAHTGTIGIKTGSSSVSDLMVKDIPNPEQVLRLIQELRDRHQAVATTKAPADHALNERKNHLRKAIEMADADMIKRLENILKS